MPNLKKELGIIEEPKVEVAEEEDQNKCSNCNGKLTVPFFYESNENIFLCAKCEKKDTEKITLIKIRDPNFFSETAFVSLNKIRNEDLKVNKDNEEKYLE